MPQVGFESTIPVFQRAKTFHDLDRAAAVIGQVKTARKKESFHEFKYST
jgi:hypothetical protein